MVTVEDMYLKAKWYDTEMRDANSSHFQPLAIHSSVPDAGWFHADSLEHPLCHFSVTRQPSL